MNRLFSFLKQAFTGAIWRVGDAFRTNGFGGCFFWILVIDIAAGLASYGLGFIFPVFTLVAMLCLGVFSAILAVICVFVGLILVSKEPFALIAYLALAYLSGKMALSIFGMLTIGL